MRCPYKIRISGKKFSGNFISQHVIVEKERQITIYYNISPNAKVIAFNYNQNTNRQESILAFINDFKNQSVDSKSILDRLLKG